MGNNDNKNGSRRAFFSNLVRAKKTTRVKMLTPDGKLVEVDKEVLDAAIQRKKANNQDIYQWMDNPSKD